MSYLSNFRSSIFFLLYSFSVIGNCSDDGTTPISKMNVVSDNGDSLFICAPEGVFKEIKFVSDGKVFRITNSMLLDITGYKVEISGMRMRFYDGSYGDSSNINYVSMPLIIKSKSDASDFGHLGEIVFTFDKILGSKVEIYNKEDQVELIGRYRFNGYGRGNKK